MFYDCRPGHEREIVSIAIDTMRHDTGKLTAVDLTGDEPVFYCQEAVEGPWPGHIRCRDSDEHSPISSPTYSIAQAQTMIARHEHHGGLSV